MEGTRVRVQFDRDTVLEQTHGAEFVALDTMNFWIDTRRDALVSVLKRVDLLFINDEEAGIKSLALSPNRERMGSMPILVEIPEGSI